jgi:hypothetical protein
VPICSHTVDQRLAIVAALHPEFELPEDYAGRAAQCLRGKAAVAWYSVSAALQEPPGGAPDDVARIRQKADEMFPERKGETVEQEEPETKCERCGKVCDPDELVTDTGNPTPCHDCVIRAREIERDREV